MLDSLLMVMKAITNLSFTVHKGILLMQKFVCICKEAHCTCLYFLGRRAGCSPYSRCIKLDYTEKSTHQSGKSPLSKLYLFLQPISFLPINVYRICGMYEEKCIKSVRKRVKSTLWILKVANSKVTSCVEHFTACQTRFK